MGLANTVNTMSKLAFDLLGDLKASITYTRKGTITYNPDTDASTSTDTTLTIDVVVVSDKAIEQEASPATAYEIKILVHTNDLAGLTPQETDLVTLRGKTYKVNRVATPPSNPIYILYLIRM